MAEIMGTLAVVLAAVFTAMAIIANKLSKHEFVCKKCGCTAKFGFVRLLFVTHYENEYRIDCPQCGGKDMLEK